MTTNPSTSHTTMIPPAPTPRSGALSDTAILVQIALGDIKIEPFNRDALGSNSYDVRLGRWLAVYRDPVIDVARDNPVDYILIPDSGYRLEPDVLYLGTTLEYTETHGFLPWLDGCSSLARLGLTIHQSAGRGDAGFCGHWTLEISVKRTRPRPWWSWLTPWYKEGVIVYPGQRIGQITYFDLSGEVQRPYDRKPRARYIQQGRELDPRPQPSRSWREFQREAR